MRTLVRAAKQLSALLVVTLLSALSMRAQQFSLSGVIERQVHWPSKDWGHTNHFEMSVDSCRMLVLSSNLSSKISVQTSFGSNTMHQMVSFFGEKATVTNSGKIYPGPMYETDGSLTEYLWLAYASKCYFERASHYLEPIWLLNDEELRKEHFTLKADWALLPGEGGLPSKVSWFSDGFVRQNMNGKRSVWPEPLPFDKGYTNAFYEVLATTNYNGTVIPTEFKFTRFEPRDGKLVPWLIISGRISVVRKLQSTKFLPTFTGPASIRDFRYRTASPPVSEIDYRSENGSWSEEKGARRYGMEVQRQSPKKKGSLLY